uniref:Uncharacterized protein n=1 Tax=viral metagenome TaxID=1070528 RepID=A0A6C0H8L9_9ZZZZ
MDNRYFSYNCPPLMQDKRYLTDYVKNSTYEQYIRNKNNIYNSWDYKRFLQNTALETINESYKTAIKQNTCKVNCVSKLSKLY